MVQGERALGAFAQFTGHGERGGAEQAALADAQVLGSPTNLHPLIRPHASAAGDSALSSAVRLKGRCWESNLRILGYVPSVYHTLKWQERGPQSTATSSPEIYCEW